MLFVNNTQTDPHLNLALEEYLLRQAETDQAAAPFLYQRAGGDYRP
jgi:lipoate-protein ligase A